MRKLRASSQEFHAVKLTRQRLESIYRYAIAKYLSDLDLWQNSTRDGVSSKKVSTALMYCLKFLLIMFVVESFAWSHLVTVTKTHGDKR